MSAVSAEFLARWRQEIVTLTGGDRRRAQVPITQAYVRRGRLRRKHKAWAGPDINATVVGGNNDEPWQATYNPTTDWTLLPNVISCDLQGTIDDHGQALTLVVENVRLTEITEGFAALYHGIERGFLSPWRGLETSFTPPAPTDTNEWTQLLDQKLQIKVWQGYGEDEMVPTFIGFLDDDDIVVQPDQITITARDTSQIMVDQRFYGWSKEQGIPDPITFSDRIDATQQTKVGLNADASSEQVDHEAAKVLDGDPDTRWLSDDHGDPDHTEWIEIELPEGVYTSFSINTANYANMAAWISLYVMDGDEIDSVPMSEGWYDPDSTSVPGTGDPFFKTFTTSDGTKKVSLGVSLMTTGGARLRISFRDLKNKSGDYRAGVIGFKAIRQELTSAEFTEGWILVDDVADIVRLILRWSGFKDWYVEDADMRLKKKWIVNRESFLMDMIDHIREQTGFEFFINDPDEDDASLGFPVFRMKRALYEIDADEIPVIQDTDLLTRAQAQFTTEPLSYNIRVRGRLATKDEGGVVVSRDARRLLALYKPPWIDDDEPVEGTRLAGIIKRTFLDRFYLKTQDAVEYAARLVALYEALAAATAIIQIPANPGLEFDQHVLLADRVTGLNTRLWTTQRSSSFTGGREPKWVMTIGGALLDTPFMDDMRAEVKSFLATMDE